MTKQCEECGCEFNVKDSKAHLRKTCSRECSASYKANSVEKFLRLTQVGHADECWPYVGNRDIENYGRMMIKGITWKAHRLAYVLANGKIADNLVVCHSCDNPPCCNPAHLFLGTPRDNTDDMMAKERSCRGERNRHCKVTAKDVVEIRAWRKIGAPVNVLADRYGLTPAVISKIVLKQTWRHVQ